MLSWELDYEDIEEIFIDTEIYTEIYTDSAAVLGYINNDARRFHMYVGNRVQYIRDPEVRKIANVFTTSV